MASAKALVKKVNKLRNQVERKNEGRNYNRPDSERFRVSAGKLARASFELRMAVESQGIDLLPKPTRRMRNEVVSL